MEWNYLSPPAIVVKQEIKSYVRIYTQARRDEFESGGELADQWGEKKKR